MIAILKANIIRYKILIAISTTLAGLAGTLGYIARSTEKTATAASAMERRQSDAQAADSQFWKDVSSKTRKDWK